jgi:hypothetical protein
LKIIRMTEKQMQKLEAASPEVKSADLVAGNIELKLTRKNGRLSF